MNTSYKNKHITNILQIAKKVLILVINMRSEVGPDGKYSDLEPEKLRTVQEKILGIESVNPPTFAERLRDKFNTFWYKYELFVCGGLLLLGGVSGGLLVLKVAESEEARKSFVQVTMIGTGVLGGVALALGIVLIGGNAMYNYVIRPRRKQ